MNEARVYADGFERSFAEVKDLLEFLAERGRNAKWIRKPTNTLRLAPLEKEAQNLDAADASMEEILDVHQYGNVGMELVHVVQLETA